MLSRSATEVPKTIFFCRTKNDCSKVYYHLAKAAVCKRTVSMYHASLTQATKAQLYDDFKSGVRLLCLSATIAFGMVINKTVKQCMDMHGLHLGDGHT